MKLQWAGWVWLSCMVVVMISCRDGQEKNADAAPPAGASFTVDTFSAFPPETDGCGCAFSGDSLLSRRNIFIYADDYGEMGFVKINGAFVQFKLSGANNTQNNTTIKGRPMVMNC